MLSEHLDQATGLRRLFGRQAPHIVTFAAGNAGVGKSLLVTNLACALARQGKEVLVFDENTRNTVASLCGSQARHDLLKVINREKELSDVLLPVSPGVRVLPAALAVKKLGSLTPAQRAALLESITGMERPADVILIDASQDHPLGFSPLGLAAHDTVVVVSANGASITDAYALIKKVSLGYARKHFRILVSKARSQNEAMAIHGNISHVTQSRGIARLEFAGFVPHDENLKQSSRLGQPIIGLFPEAPASRAYRAIANNLLSWPLPGGEGGGVEQFLQQLLHLSQHTDPVAIYA